MGLIGSLLRMFLGRSGGGMLARMLGGPMLGVVLGMLKKGGGLGGMLDKFRGAGLSQKADSWVSTGPNQPLNPDEVERVLRKHPAVFDCSVVGVPDRRFGEKVVALVQPADDRAVAEQGFVERLERLTKFLA